MNADFSWWCKRPRIITVLVDNPSWILPYARNLVDHLNDIGDMATLVKSSRDMAPGDVLFLLGCVRVLPPGLLELHRRNLIVHESALPHGRGFAPLTWQIIEGRNEVPVCMIEARKGVDEGGIVLRDLLRFSGDELCQEIRDAQGRLTIAMCLRFLTAEKPPVAEPQIGEPSYYSRRRPEDSQLDPFRTLAEQFDLLRVVDNERYPAFFDWLGHRYKLKIEKVDRTGFKISDQV